MIRDGKCCLKSSRESSIYECSNIFRDTLYTMEYRGREKNVGILDRILMIDGNE